jgi:hypothetical protein
MLRSCLQHLAATWHGHVDGSAGDDLLHLNVCTAAAAAAAAAVRQHAELLVQCFAGSRQTRRMSYDSPTSTHVVNSRQQNMGTGCSTVPRLYSSHGQCQQLCYATWLVLLTWCGVVLNLVLELAPVPHAVAVADQLPHVLAGAEELDLKYTTHQRRNSTVSRKALTVKLLPLSAQPQELLRPRLV